jgi:cyclic pyranopterin phosphate synthase
MKDLSSKIQRSREAVARATLKCSSGSFGKISENHPACCRVKDSARAAAMLAAKRSSDFIPARHTPRLDHVAVEFTFGPDEIIIDVSVRAIAKTGVETEALLAAAAAATSSIHELSDTHQPGSIMTDIRLIEPGKAKKDIFVKQLTAAVIVSSDSVSAGKKEDRSGIVIRERLTAEGVDVVDYEVLPDDQPGIVAKLISLADDTKVDLIITTGGTGLSPRDRVPEAMSEVIEREAPGISEAARAFGQERTPFSMLSRGRCGLRGKTLIINLPGSSKGAEESLDALFPHILHVFKIIRGGGH